VAGILEGVRVVDMGRYIAGPMCGALLGDLGAEVIRIERVGGGEDREQLPTNGGLDAGSGFLAFNRNKIGMTLDPGSEKGREVMKRLLATADILVVNLPAPALAKLGIDYESLKAIKPDIILVHTSSFGPEGPYSDRVGFDGIGQVMCGASYLSGPPGYPTRHFSNWVDCTTALFNAYGALAALLHKRATGEGQKVETNLLRSSLNVTSSLIIEEALTGIGRTSTGNRQQSGGPGDLVRTKDGWVLVQIVGNNLFKRWCKLLGEEQLLSDPRFDTDAKRGAPAAGEMLSQKTIEWAEKLTSAQALEALAGAMIPAGPLLSARQVLEDPHIKEAGFYTNVDYPDAPRPVPYVEPGAKFGGQRTPINRPPRIGEHTDQILAELGYAKAEIEALRSSGDI